MLGNGVDFNENPKSEPNFIFFIQTGDSPGLHREGHGTWEW